MLGSVNAPGAAYLSVKTRLRSLELELDRQEKLTGSGDPTAQTPAQVGQIYINTATGEEWKCVESGDGGTAWEKLTGSTVGLTAEDVGALPESAKGKPNGVAGLDAGGKVPAAQLPSLAPFAAGASAPADKAKLWIDTTANTGGLKYWNGSAWVHVPVAYT